MHHHLRYRAHIDGLRAIAVLGVVLFHFGATWLPGGFIGVDVFFVISGFLIARSIYADTADGSFSILGFYERRIRRIAPAFLAVTALTSLCAFLLFFPNQLMLYARSLMWSVLAFGNVYFYLRTDYFGPAAEDTPLLHYWSLGVEEQFYFLFPALILGCRRFFPKALPQLVLGLLVASLAACELIRPYNPAAAFYLLPFRAFELLIGAALALPGLRFPQDARIGGAAVAAGAGLILAGMALITERSPFPGLLALVPCLGTALAIWGGESVTSAPARLLGTRVPLFFGAISYSLYLVHWPIVVFARPLLPDLPASAFLIGGVALSTLLGWASWRFVEQPVRRNRTGFPRGALTAFGAIAENQRGFPGRFGPEIARVLAFERSPLREIVRDGTCFINGREPMRTLPPQCLPEQRPSLVVWGSSHIAQFVGALAEAAGRHGYAFGQITGAACVPLVDAEASPMCDALNRFALDWLLEHRPSIVVLGGDAAYGPEVWKRFDRDFARLHAAGIRVVLVGPVPQFRRPPPQVLAERLYRGNPSVLADDNLEPIALVADRALAAHFAGNPDVEYVSILTTMCPDANCPMMVDGEPLGFDPSHFTHKGVAFYGGKLADIVFAGTPPAAPAKAP